MSAAARSFWVAGTPAPQGSKRHVGRGILVESSKLVKPWREAVKWAALSAPEQIALPGPVAVDIVFHLKRPKSAKADALPATRPDLDKLIRSTLDGLTEAAVFEDDARVCRLLCEKVYALDGRCGAFIAVSRMVR